MQKNSIIIEMFGLPGVGKTTLANGYVEKNDSLVIDGQRSNILLVLFLIKHPKIFFYWVFEIIKESFKLGSCKLIKFKLALVFSVFCKIIRAHQEKKYNQIIIDEGMLQRILSVFEHKLSEEKLKNIIKTKIILPEKIIVLENNRDNFTRYRAQTNNRTKMGKKYLNNWIEVTRHNFNLVLKVLDSLDISYERKT